MFAVLLTSWAWVRVRRFRRGPGILERWQHQQRACHPRKMSLKHRQGGAPASITAKDPKLVLRNSRRRCKQIATWLMTLTLGAARWHPRGVDIKLGVA